MKRPARILLAIGITVAVIVVAALALSPKGPGNGLVDAKQFAELQKQGVRVIDVRTAAEFSDGHIPGAENVPLSSFADELTKWDTSAAIALYCATGSRSAEAAQMLKAAGFEKVYDLSGGLVAWGGTLEGGSASQTAETPAAQPTAVPVMYEFYTDW